MKIARPLGEMGSLLALAALGMTVGCSHLFPNSRSLVQERWGESLEANVAKMTAHPDAGAVGEPLALDPRSGELVAGEYYESQRPGATSSGVPSIIQIDASN